MLQHSRFGVPDRAHGYCVDDNARALLLMAWAHDLPLEFRCEQAAIYAAFIEHAWNEEALSFRNFLGYDRQWLESAGSPDSNCRTWWALCAAARNFPDPGIASWAATLRDHVAPFLTKQISPRATAFCILGARRACEGPFLSPEAPAILKAGSERLQACLRANTRSDWIWFEPYLAYDNARLCEALIVGGDFLNDSVMVALGTDALAWLADWESHKEGHFSPVGTQSFGIAHTSPAPFDQQPLEAWAMIDACIAAFSVDRSSRWKDTGERAFNWFTGANCHTSSLVDAVTGECFDGLGEVEVNLNRGAESVLSWQCARRRIEVLRQLDNS